MLVLSRKPGEGVMIGDQIRVSVVRIGPHSVRLGFEAPRDMNIVREELEVPLQPGEELELDLVGS